MLEEQVKEGIVLGILGRKSAVVSINKIYKASYPKKTRISEKSLFSLFFHEKLFIPKQTFFTHLHGKTTALNLSKLSINSTDKATPSQPNQISPKVI